MQWSATWASSTFCSGGIATRRPSAARSCLFAANPQTACRCVRLWRLCVGVRACVLRCLGPYLPTCLPYCLPACACLPAYRCGNKQTVTAAALQLVIGVHPRPPFTRAHVRRMSAPTNSPLTFPSYRPFMLLVLVVVVVVVRRTLTTPPRPSMPRITKSASWSAWWSRYSEPATEAPHHRHSRTIGITTPPRRPRLSRQRPRHWMKRNLLAVLASRRRGEAVIVEKGRLLLHGLSGRCQYDRCWRIIGFMCGTPLTTTTSTTTTTTTTARQRTA